MSIIDALDDIKTTIIDGTDPETAIAQASEDYGFAVTMLRNRAVLAFGDLSALAATHTARKAAMADQEQAALRKVALSKAEDRIRAHNALPPGHKDRLSRQQMEELIELANALGGKWSVVTKVQRAPRMPRDPLAALLRLLAG